MDAGDRCVTLDPETPTTVYIGTGSDGVYRSTDGGDTWRQVSAGFPRISMKLTSRSGKVSHVTVTDGVTAIAIDPASPRTLYAATRQSRVYRSTNAGGSWHPFNAGLAARDIRALAVDASGMRLYAGVADGGVVSLHGH